jgi:tetratricopeptide (TPR) repeat protein
MSAPSCDFEAQMSAGKAFLFDSSQRASAYAEAEKCFRRALAVCPDNAETVAYLAWSMDSQGRTTEAKEHYERALRLDPNLDIARTRYALVLEELYGGSVVETATGKTRPFTRFPETIASLADVEQAVWKHVLSHIPKDALKIGKNSRVVTIGSCFAANMAHGLRLNGVAATNLTVGEAINSTYANLEFFEWSLGLSQSVSEEFFQKFSKEEIDVLLRQADLLIYTLGVAPCFFEKSTGNFILPRKGDGVRGVMNGKYVFRTTTVKENYDNLKSIISIVRRSNPKIQIVFSLSPVPLLSTLESRSAMEADCISKATLRIAVDQVIMDSPDCVYWPSFEVVRWLGSYVPGMYGNEDGSTHHVSEDVIDLIVRAFLQIFSDPSDKISPYN